EMKSAPAQAARTSAMGGARQSWNLYDPPHPPAALLDTDSVVSKIVHVSSGMAGTSAPKIVLAAAERSDGRLGETRILECQRAIHASIPAQTGGIKIQGVRRV